MTLNKEPNLVLLRHGISLTNEGRSTATEQQNLLSKRGLQQTINRAQDFRSQYPDLNFNTVHVSTYPRAVQTSLNFLTVIENNPIDLHYHHDFRERDYGFNRYIATSQLIQQYGEKTVESWDIDIHAKPHAHGESQHEVYCRSISTFNQIVVPDLQKGMKVLVVSHHYVIRALLAYINSGTSDSMIKYNPENCFPYVVHWT